LDAQHWTTIGSVSANGTTTELSAYNFDDTNPVTGNNYYRLKVIDHDATYEYSPILRINIIGKSSNGISQIYPNPTKGTLNVLLNATKDQTVLFNVHDVLGRNVANISRDIKEGANRLEFNFSNLSSGTYILSYIDAKGERYYAKFVKD
jgi:hypothetical protein